MSPERLREIEEAARYVPVQVIVGRDTFDELLAAAREGIDAREALWKVIALTAEYSLATEGIGNEDEALILLNEAKAERLALDVSRKA